MLGSDTGGLRFLAGSKPFFFLYWAYFRRSFVHSAHSSLTADAAALSELFIFAQRSFSRHL